MAIETMNITGLDGTLAFINNNVPGFIPMFLFAIFAMITWGTYAGSRRFNGQGDIFASLTVGSFVTTIAAVAMTLGEGIISLRILTICIVITIICFILMAITRERY